MYVRSRCSGSLASSCLIDSERSCDSRCTVASLFYIFPWIPPSLAYVPDISPGQSESKSNLTFSLAAFLPLSTMAPFVAVHALYSFALGDLGNITQQALCCAGMSNGLECAICPNQDLAGIGVRLAFYIQSFLNGMSGSVDRVHELELTFAVAALITFSPADSSAATWAGTLLTTALIIAGIVSKVQGNLTLHHAVLVLK